VKTLVLVPARDEACSLPEVIRLLRAALPEGDILVVDDASTDSTQDLLPALHVGWLRLCVHTGIGGAVRAGLRYAQQRGYDAVVRMDGDGQHPADQVGRVLAPVLSGEADAVIGSRYGQAAGYRAPGWRRAAQYGVAAWVSAATGWRVGDPTSGFWAFGRRAVRFLAEHHPAGYPEPELLLLLSHNRLRVTEVPIEMRARTTGSTSLTPARLGLVAARTALALLVLPLTRRVADASDD
jgi:glycosyltransferase involved in cell wall biosynthesis